MIRIEEDTSLYPKFRPWKVIVWPPVDGVFGRAKFESTGASKENPVNLVPTIAATVIATALD